MKNQNYFHTSRYTSKYVVNLGCWNHLTHYLYYQFGLQNDIKKSRGLFFNKILSNKHTAPSISNLTKQSASSGFSSQGPQKIYHKNFFHRVFKNSCQLYHFPTTIGGKGLIFDAKISEKNEKTFTQKYIWNPSYRNKFLPHDPHIYWHLTASPFAADADILIIQANSQRHLMIGKKWRVTFTILPDDYA